MGLAALHLRATVVDALLVTNLSGVSQALALVARGQPADDGPFRQATWRAAPLWKSGGGRLLAVTSVSAVAGETKKVELEQSAK